MKTTPESTPICSFCPHVAHAGRCDRCRCNNKPSRWREALASLGNAIGESLFGGSR